MQFLTTSSGAAAAANAYRGSGYSEYIDANRSIARKNGLHRSLFRHKNDTRPCDVAPTMFGARWSILADAIQLVEQGEGLCRRESSLFSVPQIGRAHV